MGVRAGRSSRGWTAPLRTIFSFKAGEKTDGTSSISKLGCVNLLHPSVWLSNLALK